MHMQLCQPVLPFYLPFHPASARWDFPIKCSCCVVHPHPPGTLHFLSPCFICVLCFSFVTMSTHTTCVLSHDAICYAAEMHLSSHSQKRKELLASPDHDGKTLSASIGVDNDHVTVNDTPCKKIKTGTATQASSAWWVVLLWVGCLFLMWTT